VPVAAIQTELDISRRYAGQVAGPLNNADACYPSADFHGHLEVATYAGQLGTTSSFAARASAVSAGIVPIAPDGGVPLRTRLEAIALLVAAHEREASDGGGSTHQKSTHQRSAHR
jgi:hypothetical protein